MSKGLLFLEGLKILVGIKVTDRSFQTILDILNNLAELILYAPNNNTKIRGYCVSSFSDNESLSPFCLNDLKYIYIYIYIIYIIYIYIYTYIHIYKRPTQNLMLAWQPQIKKALFFKSMK